MRVQSKADEIEEMVNLDLVTRVVPMGTGNARFYFNDGTHLDTVEHFEVAACALMLSEGPQPPQPRLDPTLAIPLDGAEFSSSGKITHIGGAGL